jgi:threonine dehydratase
MNPPTLDDVRRAAATIAPHVPLPTPLVYSPGLSERLEAHVSLKLETANPISVFKLRGGINLVSQLPAVERETGVVVVSTGNHGQSIAYAARRFGVRAHVFAPEGANPDKVASMRRLGAEVTLRGARYDDARGTAEEFAAEHGMRYVHSSDEPLLVAGVATAALREADAGSSRLRGKRVVLVVSGANVTRAQLGAML